MTVHELLSRTSSLELSEWMAFEDLEPWGEKRADLRMAMAVRNLLLPYMKKDSKPPELADLMPDFDGSIAKARKDGAGAQTVEEQMAKLSMIGGRKRKRKT